MKQIPLSVPNITGKESTYVAQAMADGWISSVGSYVNSFERQLAQYSKKEDVVAVGSGTAALHLAFLEAKVGADDLVLAPSLTFIASINPIRYCQADPLFLDVDDSLCIDPAKLRAFLESSCIVKDKQTIHQASGRIIRAIVVVHIFGNLADMEQIMEIVAKYPMAVIEDAAEAIGSYYETGKYQNQMAGTIGDFGVYSFNGNKIISTGGGGCVLSKDAEALRHIRYLSTQAKDDAWYFVHHEVGYNYRLTNVQAAIGCGQLERLEDFIAHKQKLYQVYAEEFAGTGITLLPYRDQIRSNHWFFSILWKEEFGCTRHELMTSLKEQGIEVRPVWALIHEQKPYQDCIAAPLERSLHYKSLIVNIPCSTNLALEDAREVARIILSRKRG